MFSGTNISFPLWMWPKCIFCKNLSLRPPWIGRFIPVINANFRACLPLLIFVFSSFLSSEVFYFFRSYKLIRKLKQFYPASSSILNRDFSGLLIWITAWYESFPFVLEQWRKCRPHFSFYVIVVVSFFYPCMYKIPSLPSLYICVYIVSFLIHLYICIFLSLFPLYMYM